MRTLLPDRQTAVAPTATHHGCTVPLIIPDQPTLVKTNICPSVTIQGSILLSRVDRKGPIVLVHVIVIVIEQWVTYLEVRLRLRLSSDGWRTQVPTLG